MISGCQAHHQQAQADQGNEDSTCIFEVHFKSDSGSGITRTRITLLEPESLLKWTSKIQVLSSIPTQYELDLYHTTSITRSRITFEVNLKDTGKQLCMSCCLETFPIYALRTDPRNVVCFVTYFYDWY